MKFLKKHPYITWQLTGWFFVAAALFSMMVPLHFNNKFNIPFVAFMIIGGTMIIMISPPLIYFSRRDKKQRYRNQLIIQWHAQKHGRIPETVIVFLSVFIFLISASLLLRSGLFFLVPVAVYAATPPYLLWRQYVIRKFYQVPDAEQYCKVVPVSDTSLLDILSDSPTLIYAVDADKAFLNFIYNYYHYFDLLKKQQICFYQIEYSLLNDKYGFKSMNENNCVLCITADNIVIDERAFQCYADVAYLYGSYMNSYQRLLKMEHTDFIKEAIQSHIFSTDNLHQIFWSVTGSEADTEELLTEMENIKKTSLELSNEVWNKSVSQQEACEMILRKYSYLSEDEADILLRQAYLQYKENISI